VTHSGESTYSIIRRETKWMVDRILIALFTALLVHAFVPDFPYVIQAASAFAGIIVAEIVLLVIGVIHGKH